MIEGEVLGKVQAWPDPQGHGPIWKVNCITEGVGFCALAPISHCLLLGVGDTSHVSPRYAGSPKPRAGLWRRSQVLAVSHSQQLRGECAQSLRRSGQNPRRVTGGSQEHQAFVPITAWMSDTRPCSQLSRDENRANLAPGLP